MEPQMTTITTTTPTPHMLLEAAEILAEHVAFDPATEPVVNDFGGIDLTMERSRRIVRFAVTDTVAYIYVFAPKPGMVLLSEVVVRSNATPQMLAAIATAVVEVYA
jgi:hypothetical protein